MAKRNALNDIKFHTRIGEKVRFHRTQAGLSQGDLGKHLGVSFQQVQKYENGSNRLPVNFLVEIADYLRMDIRDLLEKRPGQIERHLKGTDVSLKDTESLLQLWKTLDPKAQKMVLKIMKDLGQL